MPSHSLPLLSDGIMSHFNFYELFYTIYTYICFASIVEHVTFEYRSTSVCVSCVDMCVVCVCVSVFVRKFEFTYLVVV